MQRFLILLLLLAKLQAQEFSVTEPNMSATLLQRDLLVGDVVSPVSGQVVIQQTDLHIKGAQELYLSRLFVPHTLSGSVSWCKEDQHSYDEYTLWCAVLRQYIGWVFLPYWEVKIYPNNVVRIRDSSGVTLDYKVTLEGTKLIDAPYGISNGSEGKIGAQFDLRNYQVIFEEKKMRVITPDGIERFYTQYAPLLQDLSIPYRIEKEVLPNGKALRYFYADGILAEVQATSVDGEVIYGSYKIESKENQLRIKASNNTLASYTYKRDYLDLSFKGKRESASLQRPSPSYLTSATTLQDPDEQFSYTNFLQMATYGHGNTRFHCTYYQPRENALLQIKDLILEDGTIYHFSYDVPIAGKKGGFTKVARSDGTRVEYHFSKELLPVGVYFYDRSGLRGFKQFNYDSSQYMKKVSYHDSGGKEIKAICYQYDRYGNPILETLTGDLEGNGSTSSYSIKRTFSPSHLVTYEEEDNGSSTRYTYHDSTHLLLRKFFNAGSFWIQDSYQYDKYNNLISQKKEYSDGVKELTTYELYQNGTHIHLPKIISNFYEEEGSLKLLSKKELYYDEWGNVRKEQVYDSKGKIAYTLRHRYNARGDLLESSNPLGQKAQYTYDKQGRKLTEKPFSTRLEKEYEYDILGRMTKQKERSDGGEIRKWHYTYDSDGKESFEQDYLGAKTHKTTDFMSKKPSKVVYPDTDIQISTQTIYDALGRKVVYVDAVGNRTSYSYTARSDIASITYPDGATERFYYTLDGYLKEEITRDSMILRYERDALGHLIKKSWIDKSGVLLAEEESLHDCENKLFHKSRDGLTSHFSYDGTRRKIRQQIGERITTYQYDLLGRIASEIQHNKDNSLHTLYSYDLLDRLIKEEKKDKNGKLLWSISYTFDEAGNKNKLVRGNGSTERFEYDAFNRLTAYYDPMGKKELLSYNDTFINNLGQQVVQKTRTTKTGKTTIETFNTHNQLVKKERFSATGQWLSGYTQYYDGKGNLICHEDATEEGAIARHYLYKKDHLVSITEAANTDKAKKTSFTYTSSGKIATKTLPDGTRLTYKYDSFGHLKELSSADLLQRFIHTSEGKLLEAQDGKIYLKREVDPYGNILSEELSTGSKIEKSYDAFNRPIHLKINGYGAVDYQYDPLYLTLVSRLSEKGQTLYTHGYDSYDLAGLPITEQLPYRFGKLSTSYDAKGRKTAIHSYYLSQDLTYDADDNLVLSRLNKKNYRYNYNDLGQLIDEDGHFYQYESVENRVGKDGLECHHSPTYELLQQGKLELSYDGRGNLTAKGTTRYKYDALNRLISAETDKQTVRYHYDALGRAVLKETPTHHELRIYDGLDELVISSSKTTSVRTLGLNRAAIGIELDDQLRIPLLDVQGNIRALMTSWGRYASSESYSAFGEGKQPLSPWGYIGKLYDPDLRWYNFGKRYYDPELARFVTTDPAGYVDGSNRYQYVLNNPFSYIDPYGECVAALAIPLFTFVWGAVGPTVISAVVPTVYGIAIGTGIYLTGKGLESLSENYRIHSAANKIDRSKKGEIDETLPKDPFNDPDWEEISHPEQGKRGHHEFQHKKSGEKIRYDKGRPGETGHKGRDHYHRLNPDKADRKKPYLDKDGKPINDTDKAHLYRPEQIKPKNKQNKT